MKQSIHRNIYLVQKGNKVVAVATSKARAQQILQAKTANSWLLFNRWKIVRFDNDDLNQ